MQSWRNAENGTALGQESETGCTPACRGRCGHSRAGGQDSAFTTARVCEPTASGLLPPTYRLKQPTHQKPPNASRAVNSEPANSPHDQRKTFSRETWTLRPLLRGPDHKPAPVSPQPPRATYPSAAPKGPWRSHTMPDPRHRGPGDPGLPPEWLLQTCLGTEAGLCRAACGQGCPGRAQLRY